MACCGWGLYRDTAGSIDEAYEVGVKLGEGAEGEVMLARERNTGKLFALKFISIKCVPT